MEQREAIVEKYLNYVGRLMEENYFDKICLYRILSVSASHPWW